MSAKLDQSLDEILSSTRQQRRRQQRRGGPKPAPAGGVKKQQRAAKPAKAAAPAPASAPVPITGDSKIIVSGLPSDVDEASIKEYFSKSAGPVKKVILTYNQNGTSRGIASIIFKQPESAAKAAKNLNGMLVDKKPIKIEVVVDPTKVQTAAASTGPKSLAQRATQPKSTQPAKAVASKNNAAARGGRRKGRAGRPNKPKPKTAEELDQEMTDYFVQAGAGSGEAAPAGTNGQAPVQDQAPAAAEGDDMGMDDI